MGRTSTRRIKRAIKTPDQITADKARSLGVPEAQIGHGNMIVVDVMLAHGEKPETNTTVKFEGTVGKWFKEGGWGFDAPQRAAMEWVNSLWEAAGYAGPKMPSWGEPRGQASNSSGLRQHDALTELAGLKKRFGVTVWSAFEDLCRHGLAVGEVGARLTTARRSPHEAARNCVGFVVSMIAQWRGM